jgi:bifunctional DNA-binding transcriptional regulator/antitoxin component of YhaV-PrlF toxin-antitoxin module
MDFDYKKYSLENLEKWVEDALNSAEASPQEIYDCIRKVVEDNYYCYKNQTSRCYELLALLNGNGKGHIPAYDEYVEKKENFVCDKDDKSSKYQKAWNDFWEENYYPEEHQQYTEEELNAMCDKAASDQEKQKCREYNLREAEYYDKRAQLDAKKDKVVKWKLPVEVDGTSGEYYVQFPDDLMEAANIKENDFVEWVDNGDGSYFLKKVNNSPSWVEGNKLAKTKTYDEMIADGWTMTDDGFWIRETIGIDEC